MTTTLTNTLPAVADLARLAAQLRRATGVTLKPDVLPALIANESFVYLGGTLADIALMVKAATDRTGPFKWISDCNDRDGDRGRDHSPDRYKVRAAILSAFQNADDFMFKVGRARQHYGIGAANRAAESGREPLDAYREANARAIRQNEARAVFAELIAALPPNTPLPYDDPDEEYSGEA
jgi:hypothetical protein